MKRALILVLLLLLPGRALAWGAEGHEVIATIALAELTPQARAQAAGLLGGAAMLVHDSNWADEIRDQRPETGRWHYVNIPLDAVRYDARRDCSGGDCVVAQVTRQLAVLADRKAPPRRRAEALRFVIHFVGDIHQPLHAVGDRGGNAVRVRLMGDRTNLHHVWDASVLEPMGPDAGAIAARLAPTPAQRKAWRTGGPADWANESHAIARAVYPRDRRVLRLSFASLEAAGPAVRAQLAKAGDRLAWLLNRALN